MEEKGKSKAKELIRLAMLLERTHIGLTIDEMCERLERPRRTVERLKTALISIGFEYEDPIDDCNSRKKRYKLKKNNCLHNLVTFDESEYAILEKLKKESLDKNTQKMLHKIIEKIRYFDAHSFSSAKEHNIDDILESQKNTVKQYLSEDIDINAVRNIQNAIISQEKIKAKYKKYNLVLHPYGTISWNHIPFLVAVDDEDKTKKVKIYRYSNLSNTEILKEDYFEKPENFDLKEFANLSFGIFHDDDIMEIELLFSKEVKDDVRKFNFHPTQKVKENKDGSLTVTFSACGKTELCWHLFTWGKYVKIIGPKRLKDEYNKMLKNALLTNN